LGCTSRSIQPPWDLDKGGEAMSAKVGTSAPLPHVAELERSIRFRYPPYVPSGEMRLTDPDGYGVLVAHWGKSEQEEWEKRIARKP
jgi:hypothetical protein